MQQPTPASSFFEQLRSAALRKDWDEARAIIRTLSELPAETDWVDWKQANGLENNKVLGRDDKRNLAKCLSAFANTAGGLIAWGISDERELKPFPQYEDHLRHQLRLVASATVPPIVGVDAVAVPHEDGTGGFVITYVPRSEGAPHQVSLDVEGKGLYLGRFGSECKHLDHYRVTDLLGRRPGAVFKFVEHKRILWKWHSTGIASDDGYHTIALEMGITLANLGAQSAHNVFGTVEWPHNVKKHLDFEQVRFDLTWNMSCKATVLKPDDGEQRSANANAHSLTLPKPLFAGHLLERMITLRIEARCRALPQPKCNKKWLVRAMTAFSKGTKGQYTAGADNGSSVSGSSEWTNESIEIEFPESLESR